MYRTKLQPSAISYQLNDELSNLGNEPKAISYEVNQVNCNSNLLIYQDSSGGENWRSSNHINRSGKVPLRFKGYQVWEGEQLITQGLRASPLVYIGDGNIGISSAIQKFWQNFPKAFQIDGKRIKMGLFPEFFRDLHELQGGERKTHTVFLDFNGRPEALNWIQNPLIPVIPPEWYSRTKALSYLSINSKYNDYLYETLIETAIRGKNNFFHRREVIDEYGWRNFGDIYADHEAVGHTANAPLISHYNNQYDLIYSFLRQYVSKSDLSWYELANDLTQHVVDIDIYHTDQDRDEYSGGMFWHTNHYLDAATCTHRSVSREHLKFMDPRFCGGGPALEHNYTTGLLFHFFMTGNIPSKEALLSLTDWVIRVVDSPYTLLGTLYDFKKKFPVWAKVISGIKVRLDRYPFSRESGNSINTLLDAFCLTGNHLYLRKTEEIIIGGVHPKDDIESRDLLNAEFNWSYTVFLQAIGKYLDIKLEIGETDEMYSYAKDSLLHYAEWMLENEYPYLEKPEILEYPNETWSAAELKKSIIFSYAAKYSNSGLRESFREKARFFYNHSIHELNTFEMKNLTRPIALLLQNGDMYQGINEKLSEIAPEVRREYDIRDPETFLSVSLILKQIIKEMMNTLKRSSVKKEINWLKTRFRQYI